MTPPRNPYVAGNPVGNSPAFVGRADILREVLRVLRRPQDNAILIYGQRRIGKTSILQELVAWLPRGGPFRTVDFDLQDKATWPLGQVLYELAKTIAHNLNQPDPDLSPDPETTFRSIWLPATLAHLPNDVSLVLLFDEFDVLADPKSERAVAAFFPYLRGLLASEPKRLKFVFVIGRNINDLSNIALSLFKGTPAHRISLLSQQDTTSLVKLSETNQSLFWSSEAIEYVWELTHGHPFLTQQLCSRVWEQTYDEEPQQPPVIIKEKVEAAISETLEASRNTMEWIWNGLPPAERVVISALAEAGPIPISQDKLEQILRDSGVRVVIRELQNAPKLLQDWDLIEPSNGNYRFRVELLRRWIVEQKPLRRVQEALDQINPVADSFYQAGLGFYRVKKLRESIEPLRRAIELNPNHVQANLLLADALLATGKLSEARQVLERLYEYQPSTARSRLVQVLSALEEKAQSENEKIEIHREIQNLEPSALKANSPTKTDVTPNNDSSLMAGGIETKAFRELISLIKQGLSCLVVGLPGTGKTYLLSNIQAELKSKLIYLDTGSLSQNNYLWQEIYAQVVGRNPETQNPTDPDEILSKLFDSLDKSEYGFILAIDEIERLLLAPLKDTEQLLRDLKRLSNHKKIVLVATSYQTRRMWQEHWQKESSLVNSLLGEIFGREVILNLWTSNEINEFIKSIKLPIDWNQWILEQTGGIPKLVVNLATGLQAEMEDNWDQMPEDRKDSIMIQNLVLRGIQNDSSLFDNFWRGLPIGYKQKLLLSFIKRKIKHEGSPLSPILFDRIVRTHFSPILLPGNIDLIEGKTSTIRSELLYSWVDKFVVRNLPFPDDDLIRSIIQKVLQTSFDDGDTLARFFEWVGFSPDSTCGMQRRSYRQQQWNKTTQRFVGLLLIVMAIWGLLRLLGIL